MNRLTILYAAVTGHAETLAQRAYERALNEGWTAQLQNIAECRATELAGVPLLLCVVSARDEDAPPDDAAAFFHELQDAVAPAFDRTRYAVLGLGNGDRANTFARHLDERLAVLGGRRLHERIEADAQFEDAYAEWESRIFPLLSAQRCAVA